MLYWCEGDKHNVRSRCKVSVTSADAKMLKLFTDWLTYYYGIDRNLIKLRLHLWDPADENKAKKYWSDALDVSVHNFTKSWIKSKSGVYKRYPHGICRASINSKKILTQILSEIEREFKNF